MARPVRINQLKKCSGHDDRICSFCKRKSKDATEVLATPTYNDDGVVFCPHWV